MSITNGHPANIAQDVICDGLRVSTGIFRGSCLIGLYDQYETLWWNDNTAVPLRKWNQIIHGIGDHPASDDAPYHYDERLKAKALRVHAHIVRNLIAEANRVGARNRHMPELLAQRWMKQPNTTTPEVGE